MTIYVDPIMRHRSGEWCHMMTDGELSELHAFAQQIGLKRHWFQADKQTPHYDLRPSKRKLAVARGAQEVSTSELLLSCGHYVNASVKEALEARVRRQKEKSNATT